MLRFVLAGLGWLLVVSSTFNIAIKLFGSDWAVARYAGSDRNLDSPFIGLAIGLVFLALSQILKKLDDVLQRGE